MINSRCWERRSSAWRITPVAVNSLTIGAAAV